MLNCVKCWKCMQSQTREVLSRMSATRCANDSRSGAQDFGNQPCSLLGSYENNMNPMEAMSVTVRTNQLLYIGVFKPAKCISLPPRPKAGLRANHWACP